MSSLSVYVSLSLSANANGRLIALENGGTSEPCEQWHLCRKTTNGPIDDDAPTDRTLTDGLSLEAIDR